MIANKLNTARSLASRFAVFCLMSVPATGIAFAQENSPLHFKDAKIVLGQDNKLELMLTNPDDKNTPLKENEISSLNFTLVLPEGVSYDASQPNNFVANTERLVDHKLMVKKVGANTYNFGIFANGRTLIELQEGKLADIVFNINTDYLKSTQKYITLTNVTLSDLEGNKIFKDTYQYDKVGGQPIQYKPKKYNLLPIAGNMYAVEEAVTIFNGKDNKQTVNIGLDNQILLKGFQCDIQLPAGVDFAAYKGKNPVFVGGSRIPNHDFSSKLVDAKKNIWRVIGHSLAGWEIDHVEKSQLFSFDIVANEKFETGAIKVFNVVLADGAGTGYQSTGNEFTVTVKSLNSTYAPVDAQVMELNKALVAVKQHIDAKCPNIKAEAWVAADADVIAKGIKALEGKVAEAKKAHLQDVAALDAEAKKLANDIKAYQKKADDAEVAKVANDKAYKALVPEFKAAEDALAAVKKVVNEECKDVASRFAERIAALEKQVADQKASVEALNKEVKLNEAKQTEVVNALKLAKDAAAALQKEAKEAQKLFADETAKKAANEKAYKDLSAQVSAVKQQLEDAQVKVAAECPNVANKYTKQFYDLGKQLDAIVADLKAKFEKVELNAESTVAVAPVKETIEKIVAEAVAGQKAYVDNENAYAALTKKLNAVKVEIDDVHSQIMLLCKDVAADYIVKLFAVKKEVNAAQDALDQLYKEGKLNADSTVADKELSAKVAKLFEEAVAAQKAFEENVAKQAANEAAYQSLSKELNDLYAAVEDANAQIKKDFFKVGEAYLKHLTGVKARLDEMKADLLAKYKAVELNANSELGGEEILTNVQAVLREAMFAANDEAYARLKGEVAAVQTELTEADKKIKAEWAKVAPQFEAQLAQAQTDINALLEDLTAKYDNVELNSASKVDVAAVSAAIKQILLDAEQAYVSGIEDVMVEGKEVVAIYTLNGKRISAPVKGWNLVKYNDGSSKKVYVK